MTILVKNLFSGAEYTYVVDCDNVADEQRVKVDCLLEAYLRETHCMTSINKPAMMDKFRAHVQSGRMSASLGNLCVLMH